MKENILLFRHEVFGEIRTLTGENGEVLFVGKDVAKALGYSNTRDALNKHVDAEDKLVSQIATSGQRRAIIFINESGLYSLILSSKLEQAKAFKRWVTSVVLPQIRMTGGYIPTHDNEGRQLSDDEIVERGCKIIGDTIRMVNAPNEDCLTATQVAALWGMDVTSFNNLLKGMGIQHRKGGRWQLHDDLQDRGYTEVRCFSFFSLHGTPRIQRYMVWTPKGVDFLNLMVRKIPRDVTTSVQLNFNF